MAVASGAHVRGGLAVRRAALRDRVGQLWSWDVGLVLFITVVGSLVGLQGWRSHYPAFDMLTYIENAERLLKSGSLPRFGDISSYASFSPPGSSWFMVPGVLAFSDPRLYEKVGAIGLYLGTLVGVYWLARVAFGSRCARVSVVVYGLSGLGLSFAVSLWPIGHPFFYVWMAVFTVYWVRHKSPTYLAAAIVIWAAGMYMDMTVAPSLAILPLVWLLYRPPLFNKTILVAGVLSLAIWYPYLQFEAGRGFADLRSQWLRESIRPADVQAAWCDPNVVVHSIDVPSSATGAASTATPVLSATAPGLGQRFVTRIRVMVEGLLADFQMSVSSRPLSAVLLLMTLGALAQIGVVAAGNALSIRKPRRAKRLTERVNRLTIRAGGQSQAAVLVALSLVAPWGLLLLAAEPGRPERFYWLWPLQVIVLTAFATSILPRLRAPRPLVWLGVGAVAVILVGSGLQSPVAAWKSSGWSGEDAQQVQVVNYIANHLRADGKHQAAIGYEIFFYPFMLDDHIMNPTYKVGAEFDTLFKYQHGVTNTDTCAEGLSPQDDYRILQTAPENVDEAPNMYIRPGSDGTFRTVAEIGTYQILKRN